MARDESLRDARPPGHVLIVDDDTDVRGSLREVLAEAGYDVAEAASGEEALHHLAGAPHPDLILLDLMMPGTNGWGVLDRLREAQATSAIPVAILSAQPQLAPDEASTVLTKPVELDRLLELVASHCRKEDEK